jgi:hypothetical protein
LSQPVELPERPSADDVRRAVEDITIAQGALLGRYER